MTVDRNENRGLGSAMPPPNWVSRRTCCGTGRTLACSFRRAHQEGNVRTTRNCSAAPAGSALSACGTIAPREPRAVLCQAAQTQGRADCREASRISPLRRRSCRRHRFPRPCTELPSLDGEQLPRVPAVQHARSQISNARRKPTHSHGGHGYVISAMRRKR